MARWTIEEQTMVKPFNNINCHGWNASFVSAAILGLSQAIIADNAGSVLSRMQCPVLKLVRVLCSN
jgi:hypothetical protein